MGHLPNTKFIHFDGELIPMTNSSFDLFFSFGVFHHLDNWQKMLLDALKVSKRFILFDIRVCREKSIVAKENSFQKLALGGSWQGNSIISYNII